MKIGVIIVTFNGMQWIEKCLKSTLNSSKQVEVIVIDNNSTDGTVSYIKKQYPEVIVLEQETNLGFGKANNLGMSYALRNNCDYVFLLNQDAYLEVDTIYRMIEVHKNNLHYGVLSPIHLNGKGDKLDKNFSNYISYNKSTNFYSDFILNNVKETPYEVPFVNAAAWLIPKSTLKLVGGFDPLFFHYGEDDNYCQKVIYENLKIGIVAKTFVKHDREGVLKRNYSSSKNILKNLEIKNKLLFADVNNQLTLSQSNINVLIKFIYHFLFKGVSSSLFYLKTEKLKRKNFLESVKSKNIYFNRTPYHYL